MGREGWEERKKDSGFSSFQSFQTASPIVDVDGYTIFFGLRAIILRTIPYHHVQPTTSNTADNPYVQISCSSVVDVGVHACNL